VRFSLIACCTCSADATRLFSIVGTLRAVCETEGTPSSSPAAILLIESRTFPIALFEPSPLPASLAFGILASALLLVSSSAFSLSVVLPVLAQCSDLILFIIFYGLEAGG